MTPEQWERVKEILGKALELHSPERESYVGNACGSDPILQREVQRLLVAEESAGTGFLNRPAMPMQLDIDDTPHDAMLGRRVGAYQTAALIGVGGMGEVYRAFRADDQYRKQVALKLVRAGQDSQVVFGRFKNERQILASLDHPNIARLLDGGTTDDGAPYFVMELIEGQPLGQYCDDHRLRINDRLKLFLHVCSAVQFAHQRLVVHRDIKPSNILVTADGTPKLLDFGVSKILDPDLVDGQAEPTVTVLRALTPAYASPEQIKGEPVTTASDVYSLGVVLYELLAGQSPYRVASRSPHELSHAVCDLESEKPSLAIRHPTSPEAGKAFAGHHGDPSPGKTSNQLKGDLDNIVLKALRKEPARRYGSVEEFAGDIRRHLENEPVLARKGTFSYRASKFIRRHTAGIVATALVMAALFAGMGTTLSEKRRADRRFNDVRDLANSLLFEIHDSIRDLPGSTPARKLIVDRALRYLDSLSAEGSSDPSLMRELATAYERVGEVQGHYLQNSLGDTAGSLRSYQKALQVREQLATKSSSWSDQLALAKSHRLVANQLWATGDLREAFDNTAWAVSITETLQKERAGDLSVLDELSRDYEIAAQIRGTSWAGGFSEPADVKENYSSKAAAVDAAMLKIDPDNEQTQRSYELDVDNLGNLLRDKDRDAAGALENYRKAQEIAQALSRRSPTTQHLRDVARSYYQIGSVYSDVLGDPKPALENFRKALQLYQQAIAADPENALLRQGLAIAYANVGWEEGMTGDRTGSLSSMDLSFEVMKKLVASSLQNVQQKLVLAAIYVDRGDNFLRWHESDRATGEYEKACTTYRELRTPDSANQIDTAIADCNSRSGYAALQGGKTDAADAAFHRSLTLVEPFLTKDKPELDALYHGADSYAGLGDLESRQATNRSQDNQKCSEHWKQAQDWYRKSLAVWEKVPADRRDRHGNSPAEQDPKAVTNSLHRCEAALASMQNVPRPR
jgi:serine/threonine protein kinase